MPVGGTGALHVNDHGRNFGIVRKADQLIIKEIPGPAVEVNALAPAHDAPMTIPIAANSSSA